MRIRDDELLKLLEQRAAKTAEADKKGLKREAELLQAVRTSLITEPRDESECSGETKSRC
jgi:hypothetical protein